jgi:hypothetical protein
MPTAPIIREALMALLRSFSTEQSLIVEEEQALVWHHPSNFTINHGLKAAILSCKQTWETRK